MAAQLPTASMAGFETLFDFEWHLVRQRGASMADPSSHSLLSSVLHPLQRPGGFPCERPQRRAGMLANGQRTSGIKPVPEMEHKSLALRIRRGVASPQHCFTA
jgi:hypothetical protein